MEILRRLTNLVTRHTPVKTARAGAAQAIASIGFDDFPKSAWTIGGPVLAQFGVRGTYYTAGGFCGRSENGTQFYDEADLAALTEAGHEIACHGFAHQRTPTLSSTALAQDAARNRAFLKKFLGGGEARSYAFPYGAASPRTKRFFSSRYSNARGVHPGVNDGAVDLALLRAVSMESRCWDEKKIDAMIARAKANKGWIVFYTHDVSDSPSRYGSTPAMLAHVLTRLKEEGIAVRTMGDACAALEFS